MGNVQNGCVTGLGWIRCQIKERGLRNTERDCESETHKDREIEKMSASLSFVGSSQQLWMRPKFVGVAAPRPQSQSLLVVEAKATTKREDRTARHIRIRKKVTTISLFFYLTQFLKFDWFTFNAFCIR